MARTRTWTTFNCRCSVRRQTDFRYSRQGVRSRCGQSLPAFASDSMVNHLNFLSGQLLSALALRLEFHSCWIRCEISRSVFFWLLPLLLWRQPPSVPSHLSELTTARGESLQTPLAVSAVARTMSVLTWHCPPPTSTLTLSSSRRCLGPASSPSGRPGRDGSGCVQDIPTESDHDPQDCRFAALNGRCQKPQMLTQRVRVNLLAFWNYIGIQF